MKQEIISYLHTMKDVLYNLSRYQYENPEESFHEFMAYYYIMEILKDNDFNITEHYMEIKTAFCAQYGTGHPKICFICKYNAEKKGHTKGTNLISAISLGAALSLSKVVDKSGGSVIILGCPDDSAVTMAKLKAFEDIDALFMAEPYTFTSASGTSTAVLPVNIIFTAADCGKNNISLIDICSITTESVKLSMMDFSRQCSVDRLDISENPSCSCRPANFNVKFLLKSLSMETACSVQCRLKELISSICSALKTDVDFKMHQLPFDELIPNDTLSRIFSHNLKESGIVNIGSPVHLYSGSDIGAASWSVPCINPFVSIVEDPSINFDTEEFASATITPFAQDTVLKTAQALAFTGLDLIESEELLKEAKEDLEKRRGFLKTTKSH